MSQAGYELFNRLYEIYHILLQVILFFVMWDIFLKSERKSNTAAVTGIFAAVNVVLYLCPPVPAWVRYGTFAIIILGYCRIRYGIHLEKAVFTLLLFYNFHGLSFLISNSIYQYLMDDMLGRLNGGDTDYMLHMYKCQVIGLSFHLLFYTLSFLLMAGTVKKLVKSPFVMNWYDTMFLSVLNIVGSMLVYMVIDISVVQLDKEVFFLFSERKEMLWKIPTIALLICVGEISAIYIFRKYKELQDEREKHFVEEQQMKAMKRRLEEAESFYGSIRKIRHEMKNHMANIKGLVAGEKYGEVEMYIGKLDKTMQGLDYTFSTGNAVTDVIINDKYQRAVKSGITFRVKFAYRETDTISVFDMGIVLSNLLDNAIEACERMGQTKRHISLTLKRKNNFLLVEVENSFDGRLEWKDGEVIPTTIKPSNLPDILMEHGIGLRNVKDVAERYLGSMDIKTEMNVFKVTVMLQQKEIQ
ncbi:MAG: GHKL domain-containing protein [Lachnospiraceae bacterium]|nr:GHKL domain-containing protein [Lachnospiraceae bacterium]